MHVLSCGFLVAVALAAPTVDRLDPGDPDVAALIDQVVADALAAPTPPPATPLDAAEVPRLAWGDERSITGRLEQATTVASGPPGRELTEWFLRPASGVPVLVLVVGGEAANFAEGTEVGLSVRAAGFVEAMARNGEMRRFPAFVGARPVRPTSGAPAWGLVAVLIPTVVVLLGLFLVVAARAGRARRGPLQRRLCAASDEPEAAELPLPADPAEALAALRERADER
ncbi:MAG: hypothetical protein KDA22_15310 [Phycisphaerales bacterium]|nr:hypothetical protein [Phycisphaerales bacterium]